MYRSEIIKCWSKYYMYTAYTLICLPEVLFLCFFQLFELMNFMSENFVFLYIGVSVFTFENVEWNGWFILGSFVSFQ